MDKLVGYLAQFEAELASNFCAHASYYESMDLVEYMTCDATTIAERVDDFLTLIWDSKLDEVVGFKVKGFKYIFNTYLKENYEFLDVHFVRLVTALEAIVKDLGDDLIDEDRQRAYRRAMKLAERDNAQLTDLPMAA